MSKEFEDWLESPDCRVRMVLIATDRLLRLARLQAPRTIILHELELIEKRVSQAIITIELDPEWKPGDKIAPE